MGRPPGRLGEQVTTDRSSASSPALLDHLADAAHERARIRLLPDNPDGHTVAEIWARATRAAAWLDRNRPGVAVAGSLAASYDSIACLLGAWIAGRRFVSIPLPSRGMTGDDYREQLNRLFALSGAQLLLVEGQHMAGYEGCGVEVMAYEACDADGAAPGTGPRAELVQFTSGSTSDPKGVLLSLDAVSANTVAIIDRMWSDPVMDAAVADGLSACSWLPLSHDMGLVGMLLSVTVAMGPAFIGSGQLALQRTEAFAVNPISWLDACSTYKAQLTTTPNFALDLCARQLRRGADYDLSSLKAVIVGAEPVRAPTLSRFSEAAAPNGFDPTAFCPAYGMAEVALAVSITAPSSRWQAARVDMAALSDHRFVPSDDDNAAELMALGTPLQDFSVRVAGGGDLGELEIASPSMFEGYLGSTRQGPVDGWYRTSDLGAVVDGQVYIVGRTDDVIVIRGRNMYANEMEDIVISHPAVGGTSSVIANEDGDYVVVAERRRSAEGEGLESACHEIRNDLVRRFGISPVSMVMVSPQTLARTPSGKARRHAVAASFAKGDLEVETRVDFRRPAAQGV